MSNAVYSTASHRRIAHLPHCCCVREMAKKNRRIIDTIQTAREHGFQMCRRCYPSLSLRFNREEKEILPYSDEHKLMLFLEDDAVTVVSVLDEWRIMLSNNDGQLILYHRNTQKRKGDLTFGPLSGYHYQRADASILQLLMYIKRHDDYRRKHPLVTVNATPPNPAPITSVPRNIIPEIHETEHILWQELAPRSAKKPKEKSAKPKQTHKAIKKRKKGERLSQVGHVLAMIDALQKCRESDAESEYAKSS